VRPHPAKFAPARDLEAALGNPFGDGLFSYSRRVAEDEHEQYPAEALRCLNRWGMQQHYVPISEGGMLQDFEVLFSLVRTISRRDPTVAVSHGVSFLGSAGVWIAGSQEQKAELAARLLGGEGISLALTERDHGGDLLSYETRVHSHQEGLHLLHGDKWLINGATRNSLISVLARTCADGGPRGFSLFLFDKRTAPPRSFECLDKVHTLGVRGADVSGIRFRHAPLPQSAMIGTQGEGFEVVVKGLQLSRLLCVAISLGAAETAFQATLDFALERRIYGRTVFEIPHSRRLLAEAWVDLLLCDSLLTAAARSLHFTPIEASVHSAVVKYLVPRILDRTLKQLAVVLGARYYLREQHYSGIFQKILRDSALVSLFDGSSVVNLYCLTTQFNALARTWKEEWNRSTKDLQGPVCNLAEPLPEFAWSGMSLACGGQNCFIGTLSSALEAARSLGGCECLAKDVALALQNEADKLEVAADSLLMELSSIRFASPHAVHSEAFDAAADYCAVEAAAMALQIWLANRGALQGHFADGQWLALALARLNGCLRQKASPKDGLVEDVAEQLLRSHTGGMRLWLKRPARPTRYCRIKNPITSTLGKNHAY
jgi:alkylation response protein AidB-like acyl-CoA dehydrogenase